MPYLKVPLDFMQRREFQELVRSIGAPMATTVTFRLQLLVAKEAPASGLLPWEPSEIEAGICWHGKQGRALEALENAGYLEKTERGYQMTRWEAEQGHFRIFKERARKAALALWRASTVDATSNA